MDICEQAIHAERATWWNAIVADAADFERALVRHLPATCPTIEQVFCAMLEASLQDLSAQRDIAVRLFRLLPDLAQHGLVHSRDLERHLFWESVDQQKAVCAV